LKELKTSKNCTIEDYGLAMTIPGFGHIDMIPNGGEVDLTLDNVQDYVDLTLHYTFHESIKM